VIGRSLRVMVRSLRWRVAAGALLWSAGMIVLLNHLLVPLARKWLPGVPFPLPTLTGAILLLTGLMLVAGGLRKLDRVREKVLALRAGEGRRLVGVDLPEIEPLVRDMNLLLDERERDVQRALDTAGDLAHGLKTPLALVAQEAEQLEQAGQHASAAIIAEQIERMRRQVDRHLARARASAAGSAFGSRVEVRPVIESLVRALSRLYASRDLGFAIEVIDRDGACAARCEAPDLEEMLGNILDNACKWARSAVEISASPAEGGVCIAVSDDGPGLDAASRARVLERGARADPSAPGSGLGLAIVRELAELYGGALGLAAAERGGLRVELTLPSVPGGRVGAGDEAR
jgi:signal transduction histidine kinase